MKKDIPLKIESLSDIDEQECRITSSRQIESILRNITETGSNAALYYNVNQNFIMTTILDVDEDGMWVEQGNSATVNYQITESTKLTLVSSHNQVKVQFTVDVASNVSYDDQPAFFLPMPSSLYRFQRREFFRLSLPAKDQLHCIINIPDHEEESATSNAAPLDMTVIDIEVPAADISGGGIGLIVREDEDSIQLGETYSDCQINLPGMGPIIVNFTVKNLIPLSKNRLGKTILRAGCEFVDLDTHATFKLQRFITEKQRTMVAEGLML